MNGNVQGLKGTVMASSDKSISHRAILFAAMAKGDSVIHGFLESEDTLRTLKAMEELGVKITRAGSTVIVHGVGSDSFTAPKSPLQMGNSGTTTRLLAGVLAGSDFEVEMIGDEMLSKRPMDRIVTPMRAMGEQISGVSEKHFLPLQLRGNPSLVPIEYEMPISSAQVKSAILFAGMQAQGRTIVIEKNKSRNHTEEMIAEFGGGITVEGNKIVLEGPVTLRPFEMTVPGDISSAAFFLVAGLIVPNSRLTVKNVLLNSTRTGILEVIKKMGGLLHIERTGRNVGDITVQTSKLQGIEISGEIIPRLIDELPIIALLATQADGVTRVRDAKELKVKEVDRIRAVASQLGRLGALIEATEDGWNIFGKTPLHGAKVESLGDHRIGMMLMIASLLVNDELFSLGDKEAINVSYPKFFQDLESVSRFGKEARVLSTTTQKFSAKKIVLVGFMGAGKTTVGRLLANHLSTLFIDLDEQIEMNQGRSICEIFKRLGEESFRRMETEALKKVTRQNVVLSTGGGFVEDEKNRERLKSGEFLVVYLSPKFENLYERLQGDDKRPLIQQKTKKEIEELFTKRKAFYEFVADITLSLEAESPEEILHLLLKQLEG